MLIYWKEKKKATKPNNTLPQIADYSKLFLFFELAFAFYHFLEEIQEKWLSPLLLLPVKTKS